MSRRGAGALLDAVELLEAGLSFGRNTVSSSCQLQLSTPAVSSSCQLQLPAPAVRQTQYRMCAVSRLAPGKASLKIDVRVGVDWHLCVD